MKKSRWISFGFGLAVIGATLVFVFAASQDTAQARPGGGPGGGGPLCGFTAQWTCTMPDGSTQTITGTACDVARFERKTGASCSL